MSRRCELTGKAVQSGNKVSHSNRKTRTRFLPNLVQVTLISEALERGVRLRVSAAALRSVEHRGGLDNFSTKAPRRRAVGRRPPPSSARSKRSAPRRKPRRRSHAGLPSASNAGRAPAFQPSARQAGRLARELFDHRIVSARQRVLRQHPRPADAGDVRQFEIVRRLGEIDAAGRAEAEIAAAARRARRGASPRRPPPPEKA